MIRICSEINGQIILLTYLLANYLFHESMQKFQQKQFQIVIEFHLYQHLYSTEIIFFKLPDLRNLALNNQSFL